MRRWSRGVTLVECMVATCILATVLLIVFNLFPKANESLAFHETRMVAASLAESLLAQAHAQGFDKAASTSGKENFSGGSKERQTSRNYQYTVEVVPQGTDLKRVRARVQWDENSGRGELSVETLLCRDSGGTP